MTDQQQSESRSSVKITMNAKGEAQIEIKVYAIDDLVAVAATRAADVLKSTTDDLAKRGIRVAGGTA